ncbi:carbon-nitrogen hydrolase family protein [bacterium]|nr:carbon-nitrogen hydrolase family protein [bacterium]
MILLTRVKQEAPEFGKGIRLAIYQNYGGPVGNADAISYYLNKMEEAVKEAKKFDAQLISFAELYVTGYAVSPEEAHSLAEKSDGPTITRVTQIARKNNIAIICPYPEKATVNGATHYYDSMVLIDKDGTLLKNYRKTQLWGPDEGKIYSHGYCYEEEGDAYTVHQVNGFGVGLLNCYEAEFGELARIHALKGAQLVVIPTAADVWTLLSTGERTKMPYPDVSQNLIPAHALENIMFVAYCNRAGIETRKDENGKEYEIGLYLGNSVIAGPHGDIILRPRNEETLLIGDCIPDDYGPTHPENTNYLKDRRPAIYRELTAEKVKYSEHVYVNPANRNEVKK